MKRSRMHVTSRDVAMLAGVSQASVSRAFTPGGRVSEDKRARILRAADQLNYIPNSIASSLTTARTNTVAVIIGDTDNPFYVHVLRAFMTALQARGQQTLTFTVEPGSTSDAAIQQVLRYRVDGIILTAAQLSTRMVSLCHDRGIALVLFNRYIPGCAVPVVRCDNEGGGRAMAEALYNAQARSFAVLKGDPLGTTSQDRVRGFCQTLRELGVKAGNIQEIEAGSTYQGAQTAMEKHFSSKELPDAIFAVNDTMAMAAIDFVRYDLGKAVPDDVMIAGFDNIPEGDRAPYNLTTLDQPVRTMVMHALVLLDACLAADDLESVHPEEVVPSQLVWRATVPREPQS
ncbi:MAG: LacI family DNA-binding transcriptional regulator [Pseudomonadota bacterium]